MRIDLESNMATIKKMKKIKKEKGVESDDQKHVDALRAAASELYKAWKVRGATAAARAAVPPCAVLTSASCGGLLTSVVFVFVCVCVCACCLPGHLLRRRSSGKLARSGHGRRAIEYFFRLLNLCFICKIILDPHPRPPTR